MVLLNKPTDPEITELDATLAVHEHVVELDIPM
jgi:hypothetical protein